MVTLLAKDAVKIKCGFPNAIMTGNYECAYALGVITAAAGIDKITDYQSINELKNKVFEMLDNFKTEDDKLNRVLQMLEEYEPGDAFDVQMQELYSVGFDDKKV